MLLTPAQIKPKSFESGWNFFFNNFFPGWMRLMFTCVLGRYFFHFFSTVILLPKPVYVDVLDPDTDISGYFALNFSNCLRVVRLCRGSVLYSVLQVWSDSREVRISLGFPAPTRWGICHEEWHSYGLSADSSGFQRIISLSKREESIISVSYTHLRAHETA